MLTSRNAGYFPLLRAALWQEPTLKTLNVPLSVPFDHLPPSGEVGRRRALGAVFMPTAGMRCAFYYPRESLLAVKQKGCFGLRRSLRRYLFYLGISRCCRLEHVNSQSIPVRISKRLAHHHPNNDRVFIRHNQRILRRLPRVPRHHGGPQRCSTFGLLNLRSLNSKVDETLALQREASLDVILLVETWHDTNSPCVQRLRQLGFTVVDEARPRLPTTLSTNHGGVAIVTVPGVRSCQLHLNLSSSSFEFVCSRITIFSSSFVVVLVYRTGPVSSSFFDELCLLLEHVTAQSTSLIVAGDFNIHIERPNDPSAQQLIDIFSAHGLTCRVNSPTHHLGGTIDLLFTNVALHSPFCITDPGLSDHHLVKWKLPVSKPLPVYSTVFRRPWSRLPFDAFLQALCHSPLCNLNDHV